LQIIRVAGRYRKAKSSEVRINRRVFTPEFRGRDGRDTRNRFEERFLSRQWSSEEGNRRRVEKHAANFSTASTTRRVRSTLRWPGSVVKLPSRYRNC